jgi:hypothetical protein
METCRCILKNHTDRSIELKELFERGEHVLDEDGNEDGKRFFKLFQESTFEGSRAAARKMKKIAKIQNKPNQNFLVYHCLRTLARSDLEMLSWPNSPLLVMLQLVDPNVLVEYEEKGVSLLHFLADLADPSDYSTHVNQLILAKQLIERGANVNAISFPQRHTSLHNACSSVNVTNLDFVEYLLKEGADPNVQDHLGETPLISTIPYAPGAAKFLLNWSTTDVNLITRVGHSFLAGVRLSVQHFSDEAARPDNTEKVQHQFLLQQWRGIEEMLVERGAHDTGITSLV